MSWKYNLICLWVVLYYHITMVLYYHLECLFYPLCIISMISYDIYPYIYIYINIYPYYPGYIIHISMISFDSSKKHNQEVSPWNIGTSRARRARRARHPCGRRNDFLQEPKGDTTRNYHSSMVIISIHDKHININDKHSIYILSIAINIYQYHYKIYY